MRDGLNREMDKFKVCLWKSLLVCRGIARECCVNISHDGDVFEAWIFNEVVTSQNPSRVKWRSVLIEGFLWKSLLVCRGVARGCCGNISHEGSVASIVADMLRTNNVRMWRFSCHLRISQYRLKIGPTGAQTLRQPEGASVLVTGRSNKYRETDRQRNVEIKQ
jgi:hypothetical protein